MKVKIFTEGGSTIGYGHISRCLSLYEEIRDRGFEVDFIINGHLDNAKLMDNIDYTNINWLSKSFINETINNEDYCIVDSYLADQEICEVISYNAKQTLFIDDIGRLNYPRGIVVNPSLNTDNINYLNNTKNTYLLGQKYIILRAPFIKDHTKQIKKTVSHVLVTMGGSDIRNLTPKILKHICISYPNIIFSIITTTSYKNLKMIHEASESLDNVKLYKDINGELMRDLMLEADFAITAAGQTVYELLAINTPFIAIKVSDNQSNNIDGLAKYNLLKFTLDYASDDFLEMLSEKFTTLLSFYNRKEVRELIFNTVDKIGRKRIINDLINIRK
ncbi:UDP-2,4-diacetamido-2,4,6-trideoxy-beta-L-altropyranose hydrolase [Amphibacillus jilinensis]|uniref:UDP-2,4-diacetamido-2,4, 6-trideoxy-beta-L-altropyranose hydrolase n=1 Tax=Amphibacillus jilinensis TaxID=1216008 RepID=UPI0002F000C9|nr:UDP-2,4-diacetamido-2,4,6-trideoxy-beta-L-altropyranose hydrolase [Amphibacillus jilinensis]